MDTNQDIKVVKEWYEKEFKNIQTQLDNINETFERQLKEISDNVILNAITRLSVRIDKLEHALTNEVLED